ncbi:MAG TPA: serine--tRNA ligase [Longimicrobiales bacterium]|nr:serine--tRNA ligase [Longimicrobiales bacterium]
MLDLKRVREDPAAVTTGLQVRGEGDWGRLVERLLELDRERRELIGTVDDMRARRNAESPEVAALKRQGRNDEAAALIHAMRELGDEIDAGQARLDQVEQLVHGLLLEIPNIPDDEVPPGGEDANRVLREHGDLPPSLPAEPAPHWDLGERLAILDFPRGAKVAGSGFPVYIGAGATLERALINWLLDLHVREHGYTEVQPPLLINHQAATGTGHLPKFAEEMYAVPQDGFFLVPTAEVPLTNLHADEILDATDLPIRYTAYTPCFRREAGAHGRDTRGLLRLHQFDKVELMRFERPEDSAAALEEMTAHAETALRRLGLKYRVLLLAGGDLGFANARTYDLEVWAPGVGQWLEVSSCSVYRDYQARRAGVRYRPEKGSSPEFVHTLNGSALGLARTLVAVLETWQDEDGGVVVPEPLRSYTGFDRIG